MKTRNQLIYHCERCGRITYQDPEDPRPVCCSALMTNAAATTVLEDDGFESPPEEHLVEPHLVDDADHRPRKAK